jgi:NAD(P)-dependent dehydrogenase (short-subunit alcohol dehydrogenase family)
LQGWDAKSSFVIFKKLQLNPLVFFKIALLLILCLVESLNQIEQCLGAYYYICDVSDKASVDEMARKIFDKVGQVDVLVNNAGIVAGNDFMNTPFEISSLYF